MGDSSNLQVTPRRLSKPRTNKSSSNLLGEQPTTPSSPHNSSDLDYFGRDAVVVDSRGERRSRSKSRGRIKAYLYGSSHDVIQTSSDEEEMQTGIAGAARDVRKRLSRTGSSIMSLQSAKPSATRLSNSSSSGLLSSRSMESQGVDPEESAMIADQIKQRAYHDSLAARNHMSTPVDEDKHVDSTMAPLRRKSLYTPGIATRNASDILRKPPKAMTDLEYYYDPSRPENSPLSHLASLSVGQDGRSTPCDLHYPQLGGLQLGTLRVTNGACSPAPGSQPPDSAYRSATPESKTHDEYYTASEGSVAGDSDHTIPLPPGGGSPLKYEGKTEGIVGADNRVPSSPGKSSAFERESSDESFPFSRQGNDQAACAEGRTTDHSARLRSEVSSDIPNRKKETLSDPLPFNQKTSQTCLTEAMEPKSPLILQTKIPNDNGDFEREKSKQLCRLELGSHKVCRIDEGTLDKRFAPIIGSPRELMRFEGETLSKSFHSETRFLRCNSVQGFDECYRCEVDSPNGALDMADEYIAELAGGPFSCLSPEAKKAIIPHSQDSAKRLWRPCAFEGDVQQAGNGSGSREEAFLKLTQKPERLAVPSCQSSRCIASSEMPQTDSGYCSFASLKGGPTDDICFEVEKNRIHPTKLMASPQPQTLETVRISARSSFRGPIRKLKKQRPKSQPPPTNFIPTHHELTDANIPRIPSVIAERHASRLSQFPLLEHTFPSSQHTTAYEASSPVQVYDAPIRFPSPANALEAASAPLGSSEIATSRTRASTVVDEDDWGASNLIRSPSWSEFGGGKRKKEQRKLAKEEKEIEKRLVKEVKENEKRLQKSRKDLDTNIRKDENKQKFTLSRSTSRLRARSSEGQSRHDTLMTIADFGTVTESLGNSPYDIAKSTPSNPQIIRNWYPHQISTAMPRSRPSLGERARAQTLFLDMPSVPALAAVDLKAHNVEWARERQRSQTSSAATAETLNDPVGVPAKFALADSATMDITPPVPALPSASQVKRREAEIIRSRPHSMFVEAPVPISTSRKLEDKTAVPCPSELGTSATPRKTKGSENVPDIWSSGSLEKRCSKTVDGSRQASNNVPRENDQARRTKDRLWQIQSNVWSEHRKAAGETLRRNRVKSSFDDQEAVDPTVFYGRNEGPTPPTGALTIGAYQTFIPVPGYLGPFPNPLASHPQSTALQPSSTVNPPGPHNKSSTQQTQRYGISPLAPVPRPCASTASSFHQGNGPPNSILSHAQTQSFQIQRKRVGSGPSTIRAETAIGSSFSKSVLV